MTGSIVIFCKRMQSEILMVAIRKTEGVVSLLFQPCVRTASAPICERPSENLADGFSDGLFVGDGLRAVELQCQPCQPLSLREGQSFFFGSQGGVAVVSGDVACAVGCAAAAGFVEGGFGERDA